MISAKTQVQNFIDQDYNMEIEKFIEAIKSGKINDKYIDVVEVRINNEKMSFETAEQIYIGLVENVLEKNINNINEINEKIGVKFLDLNIDISDSNVVNNKVILNISKIIKNPIRLYIRRSFLGNMTILSKLYDLVGCEDNIDIVYRNRNTRKTRNANKGSKHGVNNTKKIIYYTDDELIDNFNLNNTDLLVMENKNLYDTIFNIIGYNRKSINKKQRLEIKNLIKENIVRRVKE
jgi:hypothetical protein